MPFTHFGDFIDYEPRSRGDTERLGVRSTFTEDKPIAVSLWPAISEVTKVSEACTVARFSLFQPNRQDLIHDGRLRYPHGGSLCGT